MMISTSSLVIISSISSSISIRLARRQPREEGRQAGAHRAAERPPEDSARGAEAWGLAHMDLIHIYVYMEREREIYVYIYIYTHTYIRIHIVSFVTIAYRGSAVSRRRAKWLYPQFPSQYFPLQDLFQALGCPETFCGRQFDAGAKTFQGLGSKIPESCYGNWV